MSLENMLEAENTEVKPHRGVYIASVIIIVAVAAIAWGLKGYFENFISRGSTGDKNVANEEQKREVLRTLAASQTSSDLSEVEKKKILEDMSSSQKKAQASNLTAEEKLKILQDLQQQSIK